MNLQNGIMKLYKNPIIYKELIKLTKKNYKKESDFLDSIIRRNITKEKIKILDVASGTGEHSFYLKKKGYNVLCFDKSKSMISFCKKRGLKGIIGDMKKTKLEEKFDCILCLFNSISYNKNKRELNKTIKNFYNHLNQKGLIILDIPNPSLIKPNLFSWKIKKSLEIFQILRLKEKKILANTFIFIDKEKNKFFIDKHILTLFSIEDVKSVIKENKLILKKIIKKKDSYYFIIKK
ncbi:MAG: class I SAM-dependent methyltransferase [Candidatus Pacearchaeota archaeon]